MAIIKRSEGDSVSVTPGREPIAVQDRPAAEAPESQAAAPERQEPAAGIGSMTESLPSTLEPELRRIIDTAVARVAAIELEAIREARELTQRSEEEARVALRFALDRAFNLINTLELLAATVAGMAEALKIELDDAIAALKSVPQPESELARELAPAPVPEPGAAAEAQAPAEPEPAAPAEAQAPAEPEPAAQPEPGPEPQAVAQAEPEPQAPAEPEPAAQPEPEPAAQAEPVAERPEAVRLDAVREEPAVTAHQAGEAPAAEEPEAPEEPQAAEPQAAQAEDVRHDASGGNGYAPAQRQAESLAKAAEDVAPEMVHEAGSDDGAEDASEDGRPAVPARRRGFVRRLFTKS